MESKYFTSWEQYVVEDPEILEQYASLIGTENQDNEEMKEMMFTFIMNLFV